MRRARLHQRNALLDRRLPGLLRHWIGNALRIARAPHFAGRDVHKVRIGILQCVKAGLDAAHGVDILNLAFFAGGDNKPAFALLQRNLRLEDRQRRGLVDLSHTHVDERAQAVVLAEIAAGVFVARGAIADVLDGLDTDKRSAMPILVEPDRLDSRANRA